MGSCRHCTQRNKDHWRLVLAITHEIRKNELQLLIHMEKTVPVVIHQYRLNFVAAARLSQKRPKLFEDTNSMHSTLADTCEVAQ